MDLKPLKVSCIVFSTNTNRQPITSHNKAKQIADESILTFDDCLNYLMMEQREQM